MAKEIEYIYEDDDILVCHKPAGMATEGAGAGRMDLVSAARNYLARRIRSSERGRQRNLPPYIATVNRLDAPVEGVLVLAKNKKAASEISRQIKERTTKKYYYALCFGKPEKDRGKLSDILIRRGDTGLSQVISKEEEQTIRDGSIELSSGERVALTGGAQRSAELIYEVMEKSGDATLLKIELLTGRFHQIRIQLASRQMPILGDKMYGNEKSRELSEQMKIHDICLVAYRFEFRHPKTKKDTSFEIVPYNAHIANRLNKRCPASDQ